MTHNQYIINRKLNIVELANTLGNISEACRNLGVSRQHYYDIKTAIQENGISAFRILTNQSDPEIQSNHLGT